MRELELSDSFGSALFDKISARYRPFLICNGEGAMSRSYIRAANNYIDPEDDDFDL
jgi:hypothetical protein